MAQYLTVARPYAKALFEVAKNSDALLLAWENVLQVLSVAIQEKIVSQCMINPRVSTAQRHTLLIELLLATLPDEAAQMGDKLRNLVAILLENQRLQAVPDILKLYRVLVAQQQNTLTIQIISACELDAQQQQKLHAALSKRFNASVSLTFQVDKQLIGGVVVRTDQCVMDYSIMGKLKRLAHSLENQEV